MPIDALPTNFPFLWATTGTVTVPAGAKQLAGWTFEEKPPFGEFNWLGWGSGQGLKYLKSYLDQEHDATAGKHSKVTYAASRVVKIPLGSWDKGGWVVRSASAAQPLYDSSTPPHTKLAAAAQDVFLVALVPLVIGPDDAAAGDHWVIDALEITYKRAATAGNIFSWALYSTLADGTGAFVIEKSGTLTSATWTQASVSCASPTNPTVDPARRYYVVINLVQGAGAASDEVAYSNVDVVLTRKKLE